MFRSSLPFVVPRFAMNCVLVSTVLLSLPSCAPATEASSQVGTPAADATPAIRSEVTKTDAGEQVLLQEVRVDAPIAAVWRAYTTAEGWMSWAAPVAAVDLKAGGTIETHYTPTAKIGDPGTIKLHILNYVPERILTLQAELSENWPEIMKQDADRLMNVVLFDSISDGQTRIRSYGVGYGATPEHEQLLSFFIPANEGLFRKLKDYLENGVKASF